MRHRLFTASLLALAMAGTPALAKPKAKAPAQLAPAAVVPAETPPPMPEGRLTDAVVPVTYRLDLTVDPAKPRFSGHVEIDAAVKAPSRFVWMHGRDLAMTKVVAVAGGKTQTGTWKQSDDTGVSLVTFAEPLPAGPVTFAFDYDAPFGDGPSGLFHVKVGDDWYAWTQFESIDARAAYPSFDQPGFKQPFAVTLRTPSGLKAVSNAPESGVSQEGGMDVHHFAPTLPLPTYLLAMMVGPFATADGAVAPTPERDKPLPLRIVTTKPNAGNMAFALENSKPIVSLLEKYFGQPFPYAKLDQITAPVMPGAMENAGADLYEDSLLIVDPAASTEIKRNFGMVVSHELSHQWFGDLVTPAWWDDIWLNESFANWMGFRIGGEWRPDLNIGAGGVGEGFQAMKTDALVAGRPIHQPITRNAQIDAAFDSITYGKGGQVVAMIAAFMGDTKFRDGVRAYMAAHKYGNATSAEFFKAMADVSGDPRILPAMQSFTDQQGVPLLTFAGANGKYTVTQSRYARLGATPPDTHWGIPMCVRRGEARTCQLVDGKTASVTIGGAGAFMPNAGGTGYYRFELPVPEWNRLIAASATLPAGEALALSDSLLASFQAGRASVDQVVALARTMARNPDSHASGNATADLQSIEAMGLFDEKATANYRKLMGEIYRPELAKLGFDPRAGAYDKDEPERSQRRVQVVDALASEARDPALLAQLRTAADAYMAGNAKALDPLWYDAAFLAQFDAEGLPAAKALFDKALASEDPVFRPTALAAIASSGHAEIAQWALADGKDARLRSSERNYLIARVAATRKTRDIGYAYIHANLDALLTGNSGIFMSSRLPQFFGGYCSVAKSAEIDRDLTQRFAGKTAELELKRTIERVRSCGQLKDARSAEASAAMAKLR